MAAIFGLLAAPAVSRTPLVPLVESHNIHNNAYLDFTYFLKKLQDVYPDTPVISLSFVSILNVDMEKNCFDVAYAIDYCDYDPYREGHGRDKRHLLMGIDDRFTNSRYLAAVNLIKVAILTDENHNND